MKKKTKCLFSLFTLIFTAIASISAWKLYTLFLPSLNRMKGYISLDGLQAKESNEKTVKTMINPVDLKDHLTNKEKQINVSDFFAKTPGKSSSEVWPYALLLGCPCRDDGSYSRSQIRRCNLAVEAYREGLYRTLIISGGSVKNHYNEAKAMARYIQEHCDLPIDIVLEKKARSTWENLKNTRLMIGNQPILILTSSLHAKRAAAMASHSFSCFSLYTYPDRKPKHILREIVSRIIYIRLELKKLMTLA
ncbi:YdcF family protein [Ileibacterium valens]|uniref:YdcF family protein n=1 Tax=Ileibacterium valens TaxID=1862668 RepID=UPI0024BA08FA|nr:YdcF family protein [Ileibacterium valens]